MWGRRRRIGKRRERGRGGNRDVGADDGKRRLILSWRNITWFGEWGLFCFGIGIGIGVIGKRNDIK